MFYNQDVVENVVTKEGVFYLCKTCYLNLKINISTFNFYLNPIFKYFNHKKYYLNLKYFIAYENRYFNLKICYLNLKFIISL